MGSLTIVDIDETVRHRLHALATRHGRSLEEEAHALLGAAVQAVQPGAPRAPALSLIADVRARLGPLKAAPPAAPVLKDVDERSLLAATQEA